MMRMAYGAGVSAGLVWGLAFVLPDVLTGWPAVAVTAGRYLVYGALAALLMAIGGGAVRALVRARWRPALLFAVTGNVGYYLLLVIGVQTVGAPLTNMIVGCIPVVLAVVGNRVSQAVPWRRLGGPVVLATAGLLLVNALELSGTRPGETTTVLTKVLGVLACVGAVALWTWYGIANGRFLAAHPEVPAGQWATVVGVATGGVTLIALPAVVLWGQPAAGHTATSRFVLVVVVLGVLVSWVATWLWNAASTLLSPTVAGMLVNVETLSGYAYIYLVRGEWPPPVQVFGFGMILSGVLLVVRRQGAVVRSAA